MRLCPLSGETQIYLLLLGPLKGPFSKSGGGLVSGNL